MKGVISLFQKLKDTLCCCFQDKANPDELLPLKASHNSSNKYSNDKQPPLSSTLFQSNDQDEPIFEPTITDIMNQVSSGDDDEPLDPTQEKYEQILKRIED